MGDTHTRNGEFRKVAEHLYRYSANKIYYAVFKVRGKRIWKSLEKKDRKMANRKVKEDLGKDCFIVTRVVRLGERTRCSSNYGGDYQFRQSQ
jgi:hypothetical protein